MFNSEKVAICIRGVSGCGKSSLADYLAQLCYPEKSCSIHSADSFFELSGEYKFDSDKLGAAHAYCRSKFEAAIVNDIELIIVCNTGANYEKEVKWYEDKAKEYNYSFISLVVENRNETESIHNVGPEILARQESRLKNSLKLR